jgi:hypothetical protein
MSRRSTGEDETVEAPHTRGRVRKMADWEPVVDERSPTPQIAAALRRYVSIVSSWRGVVTRAEDDRGSGPTAVHLYMSDAPFAWVLPERARVQIRHPAPRAFADALPDTFSLGEGDSEWVATTIDGALDVPMAVAATAVAAAYLGVLAAPGRRSG